MSISTSRFPLVIGKTAVAAALLLFTAVPLAPTGAADATVTSDASGETVPPKCPVQCCHDFGCKEMESQLDCKAMIEARRLCPSSDHAVKCGEKVCYCR